MELLSFVVHGAMVVNILSLSSWFRSTQSCYVMMPYFMISFCLRIITISINPISIGAFICFSWVCLASCNRNLNRFLSPGICALLWNSCQVCVTPTDLLLMNSEAEVIGSCIYGYKSYILRTASIFSFPDCKESQWHVVSSSLERLVSLRTKEVHHPPAWNPLTQLNSIMKGTLPTTTVEIINWTNM